ncbi:MAG TPA: von Willebrand factor type A domain-containing protein, partial [Flavobacterium alvei]|nr:von Willebrand factor type A domain-containing protein [Flavobacterium alvei]
MKTTKRISLALLMLFSVLSFGQKTTITGIVTEDTGAPLPGVSIYIKGTKNATSTNIDGKYSILAEKGDKLVFSYIGFETKYATVGKSTIINITLKSSSNQLNEVVVVGYGTSENADYSGSVAMISANKLNKQKSANVNDALQGRVAGVQISSKSEEKKRIKNRKIKDTIITAKPIKITDEDYGTFIENPFESPKFAPLSTFSIDVDNASYTNVRRFINNGQTVPKDAVRVEEMVNFFKYKYPQPQDEHPFSINTEYSECPWNSNHKVLKIGLQGKNIPTESLPASNLVFLIDVSGSMSSDNKLPLLKQSLKILVNELRKKDKVAIVVYAGAAGMVLPPTTGDEKQTIIDALEKLNAGGSTAGGAGIELAYKLAQENFVKGGNNRVILATDGDFNVGASSNTDMQTLIEEKRKSGVFLTCLGYGMGNY